MVTLGNKKLNNEVVRDNAVDFCGLHYMISDSEAMKLQSIIEAMLNGKTEPKTSNTKTKTSFEFKDFKPKYKLEKVGEYYCIKHSIIGVGKELPSKFDDNETYRPKINKEIKAVANMYIKALPNIAVVDVKLENGKSYTAWGYKTKATAEKHLKTLPTVITAYMATVATNSKGATLPMVDAE